MMEIEEENTINILNIEQDKTSQSKDVMVARNNVPVYHKSLADNYMLLKKIYGAPVVKPEISSEEKTFLNKHDFNPLEFSTIKQINEELSILKKWNDSREKELVNASEKIFSIRIKELKSIIASKYVKISNEIYNGYKALERYLEEISKY